MLDPDQAEMNADPPKFHGLLPEAASHEKEVDDHEEDGAAPVLHVPLPDRPLLHQVPAYRHLQGTGGTLCWCIDSVLDPDKVDTSSYSWTNEL
jgi:hypothetical protein